MAAVVFIACSSVLQCRFVSWDDPGFLYNNPYFRGLGWAQLRWMFTTFSHGPYQPAAWLSYDVDYLLWGMNPAGFHLSSLLWHCANAALLFLFCGRLFALAAARCDEQARCWAAAFAALIFALHPLRDLMAGFFFLCALLCHLRGHEEPARGRFWRGWTFACYCLSLLSKASGLGLPLVLAVLDAVLLKRPIRWRSLLPYVLPAAAAVVLAWHGQAASGAMSLAPGFSWPQRLAQACYGHAFYLLKTLWPSRLAPMYQIALDFDPLAPRFWASAAVDLAVAGAAFSLSRRWPAFWAAWLCYLVLLAPVLGAVKFGTQLAADRYGYLPCLAWSVLAAAALLELARERPALRRPLALSGAVMVAILGALNLRQLTYWQDSEALYRRALEIDPGQSMAHNNLGVFLEGEGRLPEALDQYRWAVESLPQNSYARGNLARVLNRLERLEPSPRLGEPNAPRKGR